MRRFFLAAAMLLASTVVNAQHAVTFKLKFLPKHTYTVMSTTQVNSKINSPGKGSSTPKNNQNQGFENKGTFLMTYVIKTGQANAVGSFPFTVTVTNFTTKNIVNGVEQNMPSKNSIVGSTTRGLCMANGKMHVDAINVPGIDANTQKVVTSMVNKFGDEINFPDKPMKIGESFTQEKPFSIGNGGQNIGIKTTIVYTLRAIRANLAYFDTKEAIVMDVAAQKSNGKSSLQTTGNGKGTMTYDIANNFAVTKADNVSTQIAMQMGTTEMAVNANSVVSYNAKIAAN